MPHDDALVITIIVANHVIHRISVDNESLAEILYLTIFKQMGIDQERIKPFGSPHRDQTLLDSQKSKFNP